MILANEEMEIWDADKCFPFTTGDNEKESRDKIRFSVPHFVHRLVITLGHRSRLFIAKESLNERAQGGKSGTRERKLGNFDVSAGHAKVIHIFDRWQNGIVSALY